MGGKKQPRQPRIIAEHLARVGLTLIRRDPLVVQCQRCGAEWRPLRLPGLRWWRCHNGCNAPAEE